MWEPIVSHIKACEIVDKMRSLSVAGSVTDCEVDQLMNQGWSPIHYIN